MVERAVDPSISPQNRLLFMAACENLPQTIQALINEGAEIELSREGDGLTALMLSAWFGHLENVKVLVKNRAQLDVRNRSGGSALSCAAQQGFLEIVRYLVRHGADTKIIDIDGDTPLATAQKLNRSAVAEYLAQQR
jgi:ankyrin repeat protein